MSGLGSGTNSPSTTRTNGGANSNTATSGGGISAVMNTEKAKKSSQIGSGGAGGLLEGLERRMANKKDGATAVHVLLPEENDDDDEETSTTSSGDDDAVVAACGAGDRPSSSTAAVNSGSTNIAATTGDEDDRGRHSSNDSPYARRSRPDNELTFLQGTLYPKEYGKTAFAILLTLLSAFTNGLVIAYIHQKGVDARPLKDIVFEIVPYQRWAWTAADVMVTVCGSFCLLVVFFHKHNSIIMRRTALLAATLYFLRALFLLCTYLPPPFPDAEERCLPRWNISDDPLQFIQRAFGIVFTAGFTGNSDKILCGDTIYSGHTMIYVLSGMMVWYYCPNPWRPIVPLLMVAAVTFGITSVLISRQHYSIDVVVALFVTVSIVYGYHVWCRKRRDRLACKGNLKSIFKSAFWCCDQQSGAQSQPSASGKGWRFRPIYAIFLYFERRVPHGRVPNELAWPLPCPAPMVRLFEKWNSYGSRNIAAVFARPTSSPGPQRRFVKKRERTSSSSGGSAYGDSRHALTSSNSSGDSAYGDGHPSASRNNALIGSNSGLLNLNTNGQQQQSAQQQATSKPPQQQRV